MAVKHQWWCGGKEPCACTEGWKRWQKSLTKTKNMTNDKRQKPRWWQHFRAVFGGYFWLPCDICGEYFGGQEEHGSWYLGMGRGRMVCLNCADEADRRSKEALKHDPVPVFTSDGRLSHYEPSTTAQLLNQNDD